MKKRKKFLSTRRKRKRTQNGHGSWPDKTWSTLLLGALELFLLVLYFLLGVVSFTILEILFVLVE
jgi:hypothetical protein